MKSVAGRIDCPEHMYWRAPIAGARVFVRMVRHARRPEKESVSSMEHVEYPPLLNNPNVVNVITGGRTNMNITPEQFDKAFAEFQQFGPRRRIPIRERWLEILPEVAPAKFSELQAKCEEIEAFALSLAERVRDKTMTDAEAKKQLAQKYSFLKQKRLDHTWSQAMYYSFK